jgi:hypothetical protein
LLHQYSVLSKYHIFQVSGNKALFDDGSYLIMNRQ